MGLITLAALIWFFYIGADYHANRPRQPDPVAGRVYPLNDRGTALYLTRDERDRFDETGYSVFGMFVAMCVLKVIRVNTFGRGTKP
ncbi:MAG: hypothetical protein ABSE21_03695 [Bryobacteraceae bacterium]